RLLWLSTPLLLLSTIPPSSSTFTLPLHDALPILFDRAYSSDLARAVSTAQMVLEQNNHTDVSLLQTLPELREQFFGYFDGISNRSEEHTSELQSRFELVCRLLLDKTKRENGIHRH